MSNFIDKLHQILADQTCKITMLEFEIDCLKARLEKLEEKDGTRDKKDG